MSTVYMLLARGFEESEAIVPADLLKRAGANVVLVATEGGLAVTGSHGITVTADITIEEIRKEDAACIVLPGGLPGTTLLGENPMVLSLIEYAASRGIYIAAICAAPSILGKMRLLDGRNAAVYPSFAESLEYANITGKKVEHDDIFITAEGMGVAFEFGFKLVEVMFGSQAVEEIKNSVRFN
ncbi:MAG: DJ-1/PfpI family protein [Clostridia bacterium]|nr:DJ-1/PfpI family protein [Clostridia bacterium]MBQ9847700.1 DJ-1/PfpI family protein [Clostridia bacterium]